MAKVIVHKANFKKKIQRYSFFGNYEMIPTTVCNPKISMFRENSKKNYYVHRNWKHVTCKTCLKLRKNDT